MFVILYQICCDYLFSNYVVLFLNALFLVTMPTDLQNVRAMLCSAQKTVQCVDHNDHHGNLFYSACNKHKAQIW